MQDDSNTRPRHGTVMVEQLLLDCTVQLICELHVRFCSHSELHKLVAQSLRMILLSS